MSVIDHDQGLTTFCDHENKGEWLLLLSMIPRGKEWAVSQIAMRYPSHEISIYALGSSLGE